jgi:hypothetical protein
MLSGGLAGCSGDIQGEGAEVGVTSEALTWSDGTTVITVDADVEDPVCDGAQGLLGVTGSFTSNAAVTVAMVVAVDGATSQQITVATPANFAPVGRDFVASFGTDANVPNGNHRIDVCFALVTARGLSPVRACLPSVNTGIDCDEPPPPPVDMVPPTIMGEADPAGNAAGWNNTDVTVSFTCTDADSGVASCSAPTTLTMEGANQSVTGTATDVAGNSASATVSGISIDKTAPTISASRSVAPNAAGWNNTAVTVSFACEIDSGVSGEVAMKLGRLMKSMSKDHQLISISHLPQVAAKGDAHYFVFKDNSSSKTVSTIKRLTDGERVEEIAKMIGGAKPSKVALENAQELLAQ